MVSSIVITGIEPERDDWCSPVVGSVGKGTLDWKIESYETG